MMEIQVAQQHTDRSPLRSSLIAWVDCSIFQNARFQPAPDQIDHARITDSVFDKPEHPFMIKAPEEVLQIRLQHPPDHAASNDLIEGCYCTMGTEPWSAAERAGQKVLLVDGGQHLGRAALESPVRHGWHPKGALLRLPGLGDCECSVPYILAGGWLRAWARSIPRSSPSLPPPSGRPPRQRNAWESVEDSSAPAHA